MNLELKTKVLEVVENMCNMGALDCRGMNLVENAKILLEIANVPEVAKIQEIPLATDNQVVILFMLPDDTNYYSLFAGISRSGAFCFELSITGVAINDEYFDFYDVEIDLPINHFSQSKWNELNKNYVLRDTISCISDVKTTTYNAYVKVDNGHYDYDFIKQPFYYLVTFERNMHGVYCIPVAIEKKYF